MTSFYMVISPDYIDNFLQCIQYVYRVNWIPPIGSLIEMEVLAARFARTFVMQWPNYHLSNTDSTVS